MCETKVYKQFKHFLGTHEVVPNVSSKWTEKHFLGENQ